MGICKRLASEGKLPRGSVVFDPEIWVQGPSRGSSDRVPGNGSIEMKVEFEKIDLIEGISPGSPPVGDPSAPLGWYRVGSTFYPVMEVPSPEWVCPLDCASPSLPGEHPPVMSPGTVLAKKNPVDDPPRYAPLPGQTELPFSDDPLSENGVDGPEPDGLETPEKVTREREKRTRTDDGIEVGVFKIARKRKRKKKTAPLVGQLAFLDTWDVEVIGVDDPLPKKRRNKKSHVEAKSCDPSPA